MERPTEVSAEGLATCDRDADVLEAANTRHERILQCSSATAVFTAVEVAMDDWQQPDGRDELGAAIDAAVGHLAHVFSG